MAQGLTTMAYDLKMLTAWGKESEKQAQNQVIADAVNSVPIANEFGDASQVEKAQ
jgi:hypothetical protein